MYTAAVPEKKCLDNFFFIFSTKSKFMADESHVTHGYYCYSQELIFVPCFLSRKHLNRVPYVELIIWCDSDSDHKDITFLTF